MLYFSNGKWRAAMKIIYTSIAASIAIVFCIIIRAIFMMKMPKKFFKLLWGLILFRLLVPSFPNLPGLDSFVIRNFSKQFPDVSSAPTYINVSAITNFATKQSPSSTHTDNHFVLTVVWLVIFAGLTSFFVFVYLYNYKRISLLPSCDSKEILEWKENNIHCKRKIALKYDSKAKSPFTLGYIKPIIVIPANIIDVSSEQLNFILLHEYTHINKFDSLFKQIAIFATCLHWFNPCCWIMLLLLNRDIELSCDEAVIKEIGVRKRAEYAMALVSFEETRHKLLSSSSNFSKNALEERIISIMKWKKTSKSILCAATFCFTMMGGFLIASNYSVNAAELPSFTTFSDEENGIMSKKDENGNHIVSEDGGNTWIPEEQWLASTEEASYDWYTYEEYASYIKEQTNRLNNMVKSKITTSAGTEVLTQADVDSIISDMKATLLKIKNGEKISKPQIGEDGIASIPENGIAQVKD